MDDFKTLDNGELRYKKFPLSMLKQINQKLHNNEVRRLDSWMVLYTYQFGVNEEEDKEFQPYMDDLTELLCVRQCSRRTTGKTVAKDK